MMTPQDENILAMMSLLGLSEEDAVKLLDLRAVISIGTGAVSAALGVDISELLERTIQIVSCDKPSDIELAIGCRPSSAAPVRLMMGVTEESLVIHTQLDSEPCEAAQVPSLTRKIVACYATGYVLARALGGDQFAGVPEPFIFLFQNLGLPLVNPSNPIIIDNAALVGAGGVANGFLWAAKELPLSGHLFIVDPKKVRRGNLNRCLFFSEEDVECNKAEALAAKFRIPGLEITAFVGTFKEFRKGRADQKVKRVITTVDSRRVRRSIQSELPIEVLDASTTDMSEIILHSHRQPNPKACLSCIYPHSVQENQYEQHIADSLNISLADVQQGFIDQPLANKLASLHPGLVEKELIGTALDTLFKQKCGEGTLTTPAGKQAAAPFAFISNLAGALLALELILFDMGDYGESDKNYLALDPWRPPHKLLRRTRPKLANCEFCSKPESENAMRLVWPELYNQTV